MHTYIHYIHTHMHVHAYTYTHTHTHTHTNTRACACIVNSFNPAPTRQGPDYQIFQNIKQYPYSLKFLQLIFFCYSSYTCAAHLSQYYSIWSISFSCWVRGIMAPFYVCQIFSVSTRDGEGPGSLDQESSQMRSCCSTDKGSKDTTMVNAHTLESVFMRTSTLAIIFLSC